MYLYTIYSVCTFFFFITIRRTTAPCTMLTFCSYHDFWPRLGLTIIMFAFGIGMKLDSTSAEQSIHPKYCTLWTPVEVLPKLCRPHMRSNRESRAVSIFIETEILSEPKNQEGPNRTCRRIYKRHTSRSYHNFRPVSMYCQRDILLHLFLGEGSRAVSQIVQDHSPSTSS